MKKFALALMSLCLVFVAACGSAGNNVANEGNKETVKEAANEETKTEEAKPVKLRIYAQYADDDTKLPYDYAVAELKKEMPNVELELEVQAQDDGQKLKTYAATGNLPDIFGAGLDIISTFKKSGNILELDQYVEQFGFKDKMQPSAMNTLVTDDGHTYAFPYAGNEFVLLYYNKELFEKNGVKVPTTYDELMTAVKTFNAAGITPLSLFAKEKWPTVSLFDMFVTRNEPQGIKKLDKGEASASDPAYKEAAEKIVELVQAGLLPKGATNLNYDQAAALFHQGKAAMFLNGQWEIAESTKHLGDKVGWMYFPGTDAANYEASKYAFSGGGGPGGYAVNPDTKDKELAAKVAAFLSLKYAEYKYTERGNPLVATKVDKAIVTEYPPMMQQLSDDIAKISSTTTFAWGLSDAKLKAAIEDASQSLMTGAYSAEQFIEDVNKAIPAAK
ncbi:ABC transporter substrate-binding protein [Paenibacillus prosopidis]|uniref:Raffinose/stachyose/melibiose transport system substrate-binding protein n=1 Tax=Paenibacillus prosopidis TaxID=630520 RepID=A0A368W5R7_9BACL|nr:extracellular solute-binding protein [Paenibacillus prosopidis]RCW49083.1 raffinose/stachyose/melibiose transport system substrate-binding protein [Paenibacillus prosopidis]